MATIYLTSRFVQLLFEGGSVGCLISHRCRKDFLIGEAQFETIHRAVSNFLFIFFIFLFYFIFFLFFIFFV